LTQQHEGLLDYLRQHLLKAQSRIRMHVQKQDWGIFEISMQTMKAILHLHLPLTSGSQSLPQTEITNGHEIDKIKHLIHDHRQNTRSNKHLNKDARCPQMYQKHLTHDMWTLHEKSQKNTPSSSQRKDQANKSALQNYAMTISMSQCSKEKMYLGEALWEQWYIYLDHFWQ